MDANREPLPEGVLVVVIPKDVGQCFHRHVMPGILYNWCMDCGVDLTYGQ
jgi:hypothetical protein